MDNPKDPSPATPPPPATPITVVGKPGTAQGNRITVTVIKPQRRNPRTQRRR